MKTPVKRQESGKREDGDALVRSALCGSRPANTVHWGTQVPPRSGNILDILLSCFSHLTLSPIPGSEISPREGNGNSLQYSCLENPTEEPGGLQSMGLQRVGYDLASKHQQQLQYLASLFKIPSLMYFLQQVFWKITSTVKGGHLFCSSEAWLLWVWNSPIHRIMLGQSWRAVRYLQRASGEYELYPK